ncbi:hypothetical protein AGMMS49579_01150 [Spirochaetia bacterium]|nr:hypothetical protein AGMMS49579_01150 [Spirochaetia bacterium]
MEISQIKLDILSTEDIRQMSVFKVTSSKISNNNLYNTVYDPRSGPVKDNLCETCNNNYINCPGHFGHIELNVPLFHPLFLSHIVNILKIFCPYCYNCLISKKVLTNYNILTIRDMERKFDAILNLIKKLNKCLECNAYKHDYRLITNNLEYHTIYRLKPGSSEKDIKMEVYDVKVIFSNIPEKTLNYLNIPNPIKYILEVFPVIPICCRHYIINDNVICDDDLTYQLVEIVKNNNLIETAPTEVLRLKYINNLKFRIQTFCNNSQGDATHATTGRAIKGIKERIAGKDGRIRTNLLGKRCEQAGRTVVGPDPTLCIDEIGVPKFIASTLTISEYVTSLNKDWLQKLVNEGKANYIHSKGSLVFENPLPSDIYHNNQVKINIHVALNYKGTLIQYNDIIKRKDGSKFLVKNLNPILKEGDIIIRDDKTFPVILPHKRKIFLKKGQIVDRHLLDGDIVIFNRQPTLHKMSMMAHKIKLNNTKNFTMSLATTKAYNADFDGDEMNIHVPQSVEARAELLNLSTVKHCIISSQAGKPIITIVQDVLLGAYLMSKYLTSVSKSLFQDIVTNLIHSKQITFEQFLKKKKEIPNLYTSRGLLSLIFPNTFNLDKKGIYIHKGIVIKGYFNKQNISLIIKLLFKEYGREPCVTFINSIQFIVNDWLLFNSFSINAKDCLINKSIDNLIEKYLVQTENVKQNIQHPIIKENRIITILSNAKDVGLKIAKEALNKNNNFISTVESGSKGDYFNIAQITGLLGQQNIYSKRIPLLLNNNTRSLPHYLKDVNKLSLQDEYESRGFITSSFTKGLKPTEFFFHTMSGRKGISDTAMSTADSGYNMRRIIKCVENIKTEYDGTVRDGNGKIYQNVYGYCGYDPSMLIDGQICDVERLVERLNLEYENNK